MELPPVIAAIIGTPQKIIPLESGATSEVWQLEAGGKAFLFKRLTGRALSCGLALDAHIRETLRARGGVVAAPVAHGEGWALDEFIEGQHPARADIPKAACHALGETLAKLHGITVSGFGRPALSGEGQIAGAQSTPISGINTRFSSAVPVDLSTNPAVISNPALAHSLLSLLDKLRAALAENRAALCHSDLHERQFILQGGRLKALVDFGDTTIADPRWDLASLLYFHGPAILRAVLVGYGGACRLSDAYLFSIGIALHHANRSRLAGKAHRLAMASAHLDGAIEFWGGSGGD